MKHNFSLEEYLADLEKIVNIESGSENLEGCFAMTEFYAEKFKELGFDVNVRQIKEGANPFFHATHKVDDRDRFDLFFMGHLDTVFPKGTIERNPYRIDEDGICHGPGCLDMKSGGLLGYYVARELIKNNVPVNIEIGYNTDEETGSMDSIEFQKELASKADYCFNFEPARVNGAFVKERKGVADYKVTFKGRSSHAGIAPEKGINAITEMGRWIMELPKLWDFEGGTTLNAGTAKGGTKSNVVPDFAELMIDVRYTKLSEQERIDKALHELAENVYVKGVETTLERLEASAPMAPNAGTEKLIGIITEVAKDLGQETPEFVSTGGGSDCNNIGEFNISSIDGCGPKGDNMHSDEEYMVVSHIPERFDLILETIMRLFNK